MVRFEEGNQKEVLYDMWLRIFHDTIPYTQYYFNEIYGHNEILLETKDQELRGMLHLNPYTMLMGEDEVKAHYIVGVSTVEEYRRQGVMRNLLMESFQILRDRQEPFTYLMPADENYYLPFSFRFGMVQFEQEIEAGIIEKKESDYTFHRPDEIDGKDFVPLENTFRKNNYDMVTKISEDYLKRLQMEVRSEFGCFFYVKKKGQAMGRFVTYAEDDFISVSQMVCYDLSLRKEFLQEVIRFLDGRYHFRQYRFTYAEDWAHELLTSKEFDQLHVFQTRKKPVIMFRILNLPFMAPYLTCQEEASCLLYVEDPDISQQSAYYLFEGNESSMTISIISQEKMNQGAYELNGRISIAELTSRIIGNVCEEEKIPEGFDHKAEHFWKTVKAVNPIEISEIV